MIKIKIGGRMRKISAHCVVCKRIRIATKSKKGMRFTDTKVDELSEDARGFIGGVICDKCHPVKKKK